MKEKKLRCHPTIILENMGAWCLVIVWILIGNIQDFAIMAANAKTGAVLKINWEQVMIAAAIAGILLLFLIREVLRWYKTTISIEDGTIRIEQKTLNRKISTYAAGSIANINMEQNLFERIVGTYKIKIDTDSRTTANETDIKIVFGKENANVFRNTVLDLMRQNKSAQNVSEPEQTMESDFERDYLDDSREMEYDLAYTPKQILLHCVYTMSVSSILLFITGIAGSAFGIHVIRTEGVGAVLKDEGVFGFLLGVLAIFIPAVKALIGDMVKLYDFRVKRTPEKLFISYGLLRKRKYALPISRIHSVKIEQTLVSRLLKKYYAEIILIGMGDENEEGSHLFLASGKAEFECYMQMLLPEFAIPPDGKLMKQPLRSFAAKLFWILLHPAMIALFIGMITETGTAVDWKIIAIVAAYVAFVILNFIGGYQTDGIYAGEQFLLISDGCFHKTQYVIPYKEIQYMNIVRSPFSRMVGLSNATIFILAAALQSVVTTGYFKEKIFEDIADKMVESVNPVNVA